MGGVEGRGGHFPALVAQNSARANGGGGAGTLWRGDGTPQGAARPT
ncbi:hypothetical protein BDIM_05070 [Brevundimonas diminuta ATCC 11568]|nr:hypothetical protein BDIM_05070 [Brevundimonas diminuta ATCC 11568]